MLIHQSNHLVEHQQHYLQHRIDCRHLVYSVNLNVEFKKRNSQSMDKRRIKPWLVGKLRQFDEFHLVHMLQLRMHNLAQVRMHLVDYVWMHLNSLDVVYRTWKFIKSLDSIVSSDVKVFSKEEKKNNQKSNLETCVRITIEKCFQHIELLETIQF